MYMTFLIILAVIFVGVLPVWPYSKNWGGLPGLGVGIVLGCLGLTMYMVDL